MPSSITAAKKAEKRRWVVIDISLICKIFGGYSRP
jgi:hypothetical protein